MINYDHGQCGCGCALLFKVTGSVLPKAFAVSLPCALACIALQTFYADTLEDLSPGGDALKLLTGFHSMLGFLVVFRSNQAYGRWWEGCSLLLEIRGEWFNAYSSSLAFCKRDPEQEAVAKKFQHEFARLVSLLYNCALQQITSTEGSDFELISLDGFDLGGMVFLASAHDRVEVVFQWVQRLLVEAAASDTIQMAPPLLSRVFNQLGAGMTKVHNARKISEFPFPFPFSQLLTVMLILQSAMTTLLCATLIKTTFWAALLTFVVVGSFFGVNFIAMEIEAPFGDDANDLPLMGFARDMNDSLIELLRDRTQSVPEFEYTPSVHNICPTEHAEDLERQIRDTVDCLENAPRATWAMLENASFQFQQGALNQKDRGPASTQRPDGEMNRKTRIPSISEQSVNTSGSDMLSSKNTGSSSTSSKKNKARSTRRTLAAKDGLARLDAQKRVSKAGQGANAFNFHGLWAPTRSLDKSIYLIPDEPDGNEDDAIRSSVHIRFSDCSSGQARSSARSSFRTSLRSVSDVPATRPVDTGTAQNSDATKCPKKNLCLDVDSQGAVARMEKHVLQIATNVLSIQETIASAITFEPHFFSSDTFDIYQSLRQCPKSPRMPWISSPRTPRS